MIRTVPETTGEGIELYIRTYYSLSAQFGRHSHPLAGGDSRRNEVEPAPGRRNGGVRRMAPSSTRPCACPTASSRRAGWSWASRRKSSCAGAARHHGHGQRVDAPARRRRMLFDGKNTIAAFVSSVSDIDDLIPCLTAYQIEWNKLHRRVVVTQVGQDMATGKVRASAVGPTPCGRARHHRGGLCRGCMAACGPKNGTPSAGRRYPATAGHPSQLPGQRLQRLPQGRRELVGRPGARKRTRVSARPGPSTSSRSNPHSLPNLLSGLHSGPPGRADRSSRRTETRKGWPPSGSG